MSPVEYTASRLIGKIQNYAWGGYNFIPSLIGIKPEPGKTYAEYWMGAHKKAPSEIIQNHGERVLLDKLIESQPEAVLGPYVAQRFGRLPFLLKVLDVREMLSIQVHPAKSEAETGFAQENERGIPLDAPERNYKDDNHKPEIQLALSDFWLLHGFRAEDQLREILTQTEELSSLTPIFINNGYRGLYKYIMEMPYSAVDAFLDPLARRILPSYELGVLDKFSPDYWAAKIIKEKPDRPYDRGIFSIYFFNLVKLKPGQAQFQDAGVPHALLSGRTIEIMANSDNVIRGGLTPKPIDIPQLLKLVTFEGITSEIIESRRRDNPYEEYYDSPCQEFGLSKIFLNQGNCYENTTRSAEILLVLKGDATLDNEMGIKTGESVLIYAGKQYRLKAASEEVVVFRAFIPLVPEIM